MWPFSQKIHIWPDIKIKHPILKEVATKTKRLIPQESMYTRLLSHFTSVASRRRRKWCSQGSAKIRLGHLLLFNLLSSFAASQPRGLGSASEIDLLACVSMRSKFRAEASASRKLSKHIVDSIYALFKRLWLFIGGYWMANYRWNRDDNVARFQIPIYIFSYIFLACSKICTSLSRSAHFSLLSAHFIGSTLRTVRCSARLYVRSRTKSIKTQKASEPRSLWCHRAIFIEALINVDNSASASAKVLLQNYLWKEVLSPKLSIGMSGRSRRSRAARGGGKIGLCFEETSYLGRIFEGKVHPI